MATNADASAPDAKKAKVSEKPEEAANEAPKKVAEKEAPKGEPKKTADAKTPNTETETAAAPEKAAEPEKEAPADEEPAKQEPEKPKELEEDAPADSRSRISSVVAMSDFDSTLDAVVGHRGNLLYGMCSDGFQHLLTCSRATWGVKGGRYLFEFRVVETFGLQETIRVGFSTAGSSLFLAETDESFGYSSVGDFFHGKKRTEKVCPGSWPKGAVFGVLLNLVDGAPNGLTISLFKDGRRVSDPIPVPDGLKGKTFYPTLTFKNVTLMVDFGGPAGKPSKPLPFTVRMLQDAAAEDAVANPSTVPAKPEAVFPVALPDAGAFDYVDELLEKEAGKYIEVSDRAFSQWASKSGNKQSAAVGKHGGSNDRPSFSFGNELDPPTTRRTLKTLVPFMGRSVVVTEVLNNLTKVGRAESLARYKGTHRCVARVIMGKPPADLVAAVQAGLLREKEQQRQQTVDKKRQAFAQKLRTKKADAARQLRLKLAQKKREAKKEGKEEPEEIEKEEGNEEEPEEVFDPDTEGSEHYVPPASLTDEEKALVFTKKPLADIAEKLLASKYASFELPADEEGFDSVEYVWESRDACAALLAKYISEKKTSIPIEDLKPSEWFVERLKGFEAAKRDLREKATAHKAPKKDGEKKEGEDVEKTPCLDFAFEDWALLAVRFELFLLAHAFKKGVDDPERPAMPLSHLEYYYQRFFKKTFSADSFSCATAKELIENLLGSEAVKVGEKEVLEPTLPDDVDVTEFVTLTEEARLDRERRADAGDESATLKFPRTGGGNVGGGKAGSGKGRGAKGGDKGDDNGRYHDRDGKAGSKARVGKGGFKARSQDGKASSKGKGKDSRPPYSAMVERDRRYQGGRPDPVRPWQVGGDRGQKRPMPTSNGGTYAKQLRRW